MLKTVIAAAIAAVLATGANAEVLASIDVSEQSLTLSQNGQVLHVWPVSTARRGKVTPRGRFTVSAVPVPLMFSALAD